MLFVSCFLSCSLEEQAKKAKVSMKYVTYLIAMAANEQGLAMWWNLKNVQLGTTAQ